MSNKPNQKAQIGKGIGALLGNIKDEVNAFQKNLKRMVALPVSITIPSRRKHARDSKKGSLRSCPICS